jgi:hypothetical protein
MTIEIIIPEKLKNSKVKDAIIYLLIEEKEKTLTQLHRSIQKQGITASFQAIIKATRLLVEQKVITNNNKKYSIDFNWIKENKEFFDNLYKDNIKINNIEKINKNENITTYKLNNLLELDKLWWDLLIEWANRKEKNKINIWKGQHMWWLIPRIEDEDYLREFLNLKNIKSYFILENNNYLDKIASEYYLKKNEYVKIIPEKSDIDEEINVFGEYILKFKRTKEIKEKIKKIYKNKKIDISEITKLFNKKTNIEVTIIKDKFISEKISYELLKVFKK